QENVYPKGPSVQFYKLFLEDTIKEKLERFGAIAVIEWDVQVAHDKSFEKLYIAAFDVVEPFWVKGSILAGTNFHGTATITDNWHMLGHINGNAIYNNSDPAFADFVDFTLARWGYSYSYDVALWATVSDFPYSWPLWQRFSSKFVSTNLIANVGFLDVDQEIVGNALASETMFIHGSLTGGGGTQFASGATAENGGDAAAASEGGNSLRIMASLEAIAAGEGVGGGGPSTRLATPECRTECGSTVSWDLLGGGGGGDGVIDMATVCDYATCSAATAGSADGKSGAWSCGAGDEERFGKHCRPCYFDAEEALKADRVLQNQTREAGEEQPDHVIMCDTLRPPEALTCSLKCATKKDTICDDRCESGLFGNYNCNWRDYGEHCRFCFDDTAAAIVADKAAKRTGGRVIMCNTHEPPVELTQAEMDALEKERIEHVMEAAASKMSNAAKQEKKTSNTKGHANPDGKAAGDEGEPDAPVHPAMIEYSEDLLRGEMCAFATAYYLYLRETEASVRSLAHFLPGMRVRLAVDTIHFSVFNRTLGGYPDVEVVNATTTGGHASLLADVHCGEGTKLILYLGPGDVVSRPFSKKDTHGTRGQLLVPYTDPDRLNEHHLKRTQATTSLLGFDAPSFSYGADLFLPAWVNPELRRVLASGTVLPSKAWRPDDRDFQRIAMSIMMETEDAFVPELLAALAYSRNPPEIWFLNPTQWVTHHMFKHASVWDVPLVKPRFLCSVNLVLAKQGYDVARELNRFADFSDGGRGKKCEMGYLPLDTAKLHAKPSVEYGSAAKNHRPMPMVEDQRVSLFYDATVAPAAAAAAANKNGVGGVRNDTHAEGARMLNATLPTVLKHFPGALEAVIVVPNADAWREYQLVVGVHNNSDTPFDIKVVNVGEDDASSDWVSKDRTGSGLGEEALRRKAIGRRRGSEAEEQPFPLLWADTYCSGKFVLHLDLNSVLLERITYDHMFHFEKPVIPFNRFQDKETWQTRAHPGNACWRHRARAFLDLPAGENVVHGFAGYDAHVYPVDLYPTLRDHLRAPTEGSMELMEAMKQGECTFGKSYLFRPSMMRRKAENPEKQRLFRREMQYNLMATFLWYRMHDSIHWSAIDPLDLTPDEWMTDPDKYRSWSCNLGAGRGLPAMPAAAAEMLRENILDTDTVAACEGLGASLSGQDSQ
ncbi:unnamed protein product, partial [Ectocarpus sp. 12 AP-2014]